MENEKEKSLNFLEELIQNDLEKGLYPQGITTRFPPEPNGYLHIGHAKSICLNFGLTENFGGKTNLRFDDTNPATEETEYVESIKKDVSWLGFTWAKECYTSDYFEQLYQFASKLIEKSLAYVDDSSAEEIANQKGTPTQPGTNSPFRNRSVEENLDLFQKMRQGAFEDGSKVLRAKIDMAHPNMHMRDPLLYRIRRVAHHRTGNEWCIYPMYDFAHGQSDSIEEITHSICTLEFDVHRPLYDWFIDKLAIFPSHQYEFARLNLSHTVMSKRKLLQLVNEKVVSGWDDPRMPTISGLRRRGYTPASIRLFCDKIGVAKRENLIDVSLLEFCIREDLNKSASRFMAVLDPIKLTLTNYPEGQSEDLHIENNPEDPESGKRVVPFSRELYIEREDFLVDPPKKFFRLGPGLMARLKGAYIVKVEDFTLNEDGSVKEVFASYIPESKSGSDTSGINVKGTMHWVSIPHAKTAEVRLFDRLLIVENAGDLGDDFIKFINPESLQTLEKVYIEPALANVEVGKGLQFIRKGYFCKDSDSTENQLIFNRTVTLKDTWAKAQNK
ncbi:glutamine--tRNA ligase/YqeY domain fusion protein [Sandaracinomonas limnophila]|uniref:Glutamine--tRNA ligase n=1 Tax=Sandaracinomonas limnophila TaxID=1862386 RepID=A0A437PTX2_9BACT|nr:glutamine--tRNA ligase/YqeY domain fusion protein [Sandaracinomonas limnophila]RVU25705.1 glutamine--tRNA ligase/YqeY domain fusion protein [Sandaracinomonas limnophila]